MASRCAAAGGMELMGGSGVVRVTIFGTDFNLRCDGADAETTRQVAKYVNSKIAELKELTASRDDMKLAVLSALNIAGELFETKAKYEAEAKKVREYEERVRAITGKIPEAAAASKAAG